MDKQAALPNTDLGARVRARRRAQRLSLADLAAQTRISESTLSRVENGKTEISANNLFVLAAALNTRIEAFFGDQDPVPVAGLRAVTRAGAGVDFRAGRFNSQLLSSELANKKMNPFLNTTSAASLEDAGGLNPHPGEEFLLVISGTLQLHTKFYEPLTLEVGDSVYFDAAMPHAYVCGNNSPARFLVVISEPATQKDKLP